MLQMGQVPVQQFGRFRGGLETVGRVFRMELGDDLGKPLGDLGIDLLDRSWRVFADALKDGNACGGAERRPGGARKRDGCFSGS